MTNTTVVSEAYVTCIHYIQILILDWIFVTAGGIVVNSLYCKSCGSETKCVKALILDFSKILLSLLKLRGKKEELRNEGFYETMKNSRFCGQLMPRAQADLQS